jgi:hypothetical protein
MNFSLHRLLLLALALIALAAAPALAASATPAATARVLSLKLKPHPVHEDKSTVVTWELGASARTTFVLSRCVNSTCTRRTAVGSPIKRPGAAGLNSFKLTLRGLSPAHYRLSASAGKNTRKVLFSIIR